MWNLKNKLQSVDSNLHACECLQSAITIIQNLRENYEELVTYLRFDLHKY